ncbi:recombinase family protein [Actinotignum sp. GS-2025d]|uniref:recombinase family protein n=1 Tax=Actinotignum sp. GS-2025d TaxID=3427277 RepID=UPI003F474212
MGCARVSASSQAESLKAQSVALEAEGANGSSPTLRPVRADRPGLAAGLDYLREGDALALTRLDRLGRTAVDALKTVRDLDAQGVRVTAQDLDLDTSTPAGKLVVCVLASLAEWERDTLRERTRAGLEHVRAQDRRGGRPPVQADAALAALRGGMSVAEVARFHIVPTNETETITD